MVFLAYKASDNLLGDAEDVSVLIENNHELAFVSIEEIWSAKIKSNPTKYICFLNEKDFDVSQLKLIISKQKVSLFCIRVSQFANHELSSISFKVKHLTDEFDSVRFAVLENLKNSYEALRMWNLSNFKDIGVILEVNGSVNMELLERWSVENIWGVIIDGGMIKPDLGSNVFSSEFLALYSFLEARCKLSFLAVQDNYARLTKMAIDLRRYRRVHISPNESNFSDYFIQPLQPLTENLALSIYDIFERDISKYKQYEKAIGLAIEEFYASKIKILVIGPGKGPLIDICISILSENKKYFSLDALEKNPLCHPILKQKYNTEISQGIINIFEQDARTWEFSEYDIVISELLGSFGCNELCPEILTKFSESSAIMIPQTYHSFVRPIYSPSAENLDSSQRERFYLAQFKRFYRVSDLKEVWSFKHPNANSLNKAEKMTFKIIHGGKINGFQGFFEATLFKDIKIGNIPTMTEGFCNSWYPFFFPIEETYYGDESSLEVEIKRISCDRVWYEWIFNQKTYNKGGRGICLNL